MSDATPPREELRSEGRSVLEIAAMMLGVGCVIGSVSSVFVLLLLVPEASALRSLGVGIVAGLLGAIALTVVYRLVEDRLIDMYLDTGGETA